LALRREGGRGNKVGFDMDVPRKKEKGEKVCEGRGGKKRRCVTFRDGKGGGGGGKRGEGEKGKR